MTNTLLRAGRSAILNTARDFSCSIVTADNRAARRPPRACRSTSSAASTSREAMDEFHPERRRGRRVPAQRPLPRQHAPRRPHDPRAGLPRRRAPVHRRRQGPPGRLRERAADDVHGRTRRTSTRRARSTSRACRSSATTSTSTTSSACAAQRIRVPDHWYGDYLADARRRAHRRAAPEGARESTAPTRCASSATTWFDYSERRMVRELSELPAASCVGTVATTRCPGSPDEASR